MNIVWASCSASRALGGGDLPLPLARLRGGDRRPQLGDELLGVGPDLRGRRLAHDRLVVVEGAATELAALLRLPLLPVALTEVEQDLGQPRQRVGAFELGDRVGVFPQVVRGVPAPERRLCFVASRRRRVGGRRSPPRAPAARPAAPASRVGNVDVTSAASAAATVVPAVIRIAVTLHARALFMEYPLALLVHGGVPFSRQTSGFGRCSKRIARGMELMTRPRFSYAHARRVVALASVGIRLADAEASGAASGERSRRRRR